MIPLRDENPALRPPIVTRLFIAANVVAFLYEVLLGPQLRPFVLEFGLVPARLAMAARGEAELGGAAITILTSVFLHGGWLHLLGNMWYLWIFGDNVEDRFGHAGYFAFYLVAGAVAGLLHTVLNPASMVPTVGASGAIAGVLGAYARLYPRARVVTLIPLLFFFQVVALPAVFVLGLWFVMQFFSGTLSIGATGGGVAWWAHIGGFAFGFLVAGLLPARRNSSRAWVEDDVRRG